MQNSYQLEVLTKIYQSALEMIVIDVMLYKGAGVISLYFTYLIFSDE